MRKLLEKKEVTLKGLYIIYDGDHRQYTLKIECDPDEVNGTGRIVSDTQLRGISHVLYRDSNRFEPFLQTHDVNLLSQPLKCNLIFSDNTLVAFCSENDNICFHLGNNELCSEEILFDFCKLEKQESILSTIKSLSHRLNELMLEYEEVEKMTFGEEM